MITSSNERNIKEQITTQARKGHSVKATANLINISVPFVRKLIREGRLPAKKIGNKVIVLDTDLQECLEKLPSWKPAKEV